MKQAVDLFIIGGGINGTAIAADAAGRGLSVALCEKNDLSSGTSSASTKLIHGGLRYLENYEFRLVREALHEREILMRKAPHLISPLEFVLPHEVHLRPLWMIKIGLFLYDHLAAHASLPNSKILHLESDARGQPLLPIFNKGFSFYDCRVDDARLVIVNALAAQENAATILTRTLFTKAYRDKNAWVIHLVDEVTQQECMYHAKALINVAGPWAEQTQKKLADMPAISTKLIKGSHIIVPQIYAGNFAYILQNPDKRVVFVIPYAEKFSLIGTTDVPFSGDLNEVKCSVAEKTYLCETINHYFKKQISLADIVSDYTGVRCLQNQDEANLADVTRDYQLLLFADQALPLLTVIGGKITTHRCLAEAVLEKLKPFFPQMRPAWTASVPLPGGDFNGQSFENFYTAFKKELPWLPEKLAERYVKNYGSRVNLFLKNAQSLRDLGREFGAGLYEKEVEYLCQYEWAKTADDILWRRTKLGLFFSESEKKDLQDWLEKIVF